MVEFLVTSRLEAKAPVTFEANMPNKITAEKNVNLKVQGCVANLFILFTILYFVEFSSAKINNTKIN